MTETEKKARKQRVKDTYLICVERPNGDFSPLRAQGTSTGNEGNGDRLELADVLACKKWLRDHDKAGEFAILAKKTTVTATIETKKTVKLT